MVLGNQLLNMEQLQSPIRVPILGNSRMSHGPESRWERDGSAVSQMFEIVSILFADVVTFTEICARITPMEVVSMLNAMYSIFDNLTERNRVYKVSPLLSSTWVCDVSRLVALCVFLSLGRNDRRRLHGG